MKKLTPPATLIVSLAHLIGEHDATDLVMTLNSRNLLKETGLYFDTHTGSLVGTKYHPNETDASPDRFGKKYPEHQWKYKNTGDPVKFVLRVKKELEKRYGKNWQADLKLFQSLDSLFTHYHFRKTSEGSYTISGHYTSMLAYFLDYIVLGLLHDDYSHCHEVWVYKTQMGGTGSKLSLVGTQTSEMMPGVSVKVFQNGRIDIKGLTATQYAKIDEVSAFHPRDSKEVNNKS